MGLVKVKTSNSLKHLDLKDALEILGGRDLKHSYFGTHLQNRQKRVLSHAFTWSAHKHFV